MSLYQFRHASFLIVIDGYTALELERKISSWPLAGTNDVHVLCGDCRWFLPYSHLLLVGVMLLVRRF